MDSEPVRATAIVTALVSAILGTLVAFGKPLTGDQQTAILVLTGAICAAIVLAGEFARNFVFSKDTVNRLLGEKQ